MRRLEKAYNFVEMILVVKIRILVEMWTVKTILMTHQMNIKNNILETGNKMILTIKSNFKKFMRNVIKR